MRSVASRPALALGGLAVVVVGLKLLSSTFPHSWPGGIIVQGAIFGAGAGLLAVGLILTYRSTRVINFAYGAMGSAAAEVGVIAYQRSHLPWAVCVLLALTAGAVIGLGVDLVMTRFASTPRLIVTVATIGMLQILVGLQFGIAFWSHASTLVAPFTTGLSTTKFSVDRTVLTANDLLAVGLAPVVVTVLAWFLLKTGSGTGVRAIADNVDRAKLLGLPIRRLSRMVWVIVGSLAGAVMILNAPSNGLPTDPFVSTGGVFMPALAAAVIAKMEDLRTAFAAGVALGVFDGLISYNVHKESLETVALLVVIVAALLLRRWHTTRGDVDESSWSLATTAKTLPNDLSSLPEVRAGRLGLLVLLGAGAVVFPVIAPPGQIHTVAGYLILGIGVLSLVVLSGWSGSISLGQLSIVGVGAVIAGDLIVKLNLDLFLSIGVAAVGAAVVSLVIGLPALRVRPIFLAVTTLAFASAMDQFFLNPTNYPNWIPSRILRPVLWKRFPLESERATYYLCLAILAVVILVVRALQNSRPGRVMRASRDNPKASSALTIDSVRTRLGGVAASGLIAGVAGGLWAILQEGVGASSFPPQDSVILFAMAVVGGLSSISGSLSGVAVTELLLFVIGRTSSQGASLAPIGTGALLLGVLLVSPGGIGQTIESVRDRIVGRIAARRGIELAVGAAAGSQRFQRNGVTDTHERARRSLELETQSLLSCRELRASYGPLQVLFGVNLDVAPGEIVALVGTNGAGKSTVFKAIAGLLSYGGAVTFDGTSLRGVAADAIARSGLATMPGGRGIFPSLTVGENLSLACWQLRRQRPLARSAQQEMLEMFPSLTAKQRVVAGNLSGGEQQQLSLAMAFAVKPKLLLIDELSLGLAPAIVAQLCEKVRDIHRAGTTVVVVEQSLNVALTLADRAVFLEKGAVRYEGSTAELLNREDLLRSVFIGQAESTGVAFVEERSNATARRQRHLDLECQGLSKRYGGVAALNGVDLTIQAGRVIGVIGHNGAGKTTLFDVVSGFERPTQGKVLLGGVDITGIPPHRRAIAGLGRSFQEARLFPSLTVRQSIMAGLDRHLASHDWFAAALKGPPSVDSERSGRERASELIELLGLGGYAETTIAELSTGTRRIVELACVLAMDPAVILLDEPSAGLAQKDTEALGGLLRELHSYTGSACAIVEHDMNLLSFVCDELVALELGAVICRGAPSEVLADSRVIQSYLGTDETVIHRSGNSRGSGSPRQVRKKVAEQPNGKDPTSGAVPSSDHTERVTRSRPPGRS